MTRSAHISARCHSRIDRTKSAPGPLPKIDTLAQYLCGPLSTLSHRLTQFNPLAEYQLGRLHVLTWTFMAVLDERRNVQIW
jgi:hypothetical protein